MPSSGNIKNIMKRGSEVAKAAAKGTQIGGQEFGSPTSNTRAALAAYSPTRSMTAASQTSPTRKFSASTAAGHLHGQHPNTSPLLTQQSFYSTSVGDKSGFRNPTTQEFPVLTLDANDFAGMSVEQIHSSFDSKIRAKFPALANAQCVGGHGTSVAAAANMAKEGYDFNRRDVPTRLTPYEGIHTSTLADMLTGYARGAADKSGTDCQIMLLYKKGPGGEENDVHENSWISDDPRDEGIKLSTVVSPETILENPENYVLVALPPFTREQIPGIQQAITRGFHNAGVVDAAVSGKARAEGKTGLDLE